MPDALFEVFEKLKDLGLIGHVLTFFGSVLTTLLFFVKYAANARAELRRIRLEVRNQYADQLLQRRLDCYPPCYRLLSDFIKNGRGFMVGRVGYEGISKEALFALNEEISSWDSQFAILLSNDAGSKIYQLRVALRRTISDMAKSGRAHLEKAEFEVLADKMAIAEIALKTDIGVFAVDEFLELSRPTYYSDIRKQARSARSQEGLLRMA